ncbi:MAG: hypothetical protein GYB64_19110, partial [Chloroflexi bacterium]|nr:hypothetical protein [Chloroflexota bacterium]
MRKLSLFLGLIMTALLAACSGNIQFEIDDDYTYITLSFDEEAVSETVSRIVTGGVPPLLQDPVVDLRDGEIVVTGTHVTRRGESYPAYLAFTFFVQDDHLSAAVTDFDFGGADVPQERIDRLNERLAESFARGAENRNNPETIITDVTLTSEELSIT